MNKAYHTGFSSEIGTKLREWAVGQAWGSCYSRAALSSNDSKTLYPNRPKGQLISCRCDLVLNNNIQYILSNICSDLALNRTYFAILLDGTAIANSFVSNLMDLRWRQRAFVVLLRPSRPLPRLALVLSAQDRSRQLQNER